MIHKIKYKDRNDVIFCYLPKSSVPDKNAVTKLHQMTALEETLIPMTGRQRQAMFRYGLEGLLETERDSKKSGLWRYYQSEVQEDWLNRTVFRGSVKADDTEGLEDFIGNYEQLTYTGNMIYAVIPDEKQDN